MTSTSSTHPFHRRPVVALPETASPDLVLAPDHRISDPSRHTPFASSTILVDLLDCDFARGKRHFHIDFSSASWSTKALAAFEVACCACGVSAKGMTVATQPAVSLCRRSQCHVCKDCRGLSLKG